MAREGKGIGGRLLEQGTRLVAKAAEKVMTDPRGQEAVARAIGAAQRGRQRVEALQGTVMRAAGIPGRQDYQELQKQLARLKRKARELAERLDGVQSDEDDEGGEAPPPGNGGTGVTH